MSCAICHEPIAWNSDLNRWEHTDSRQPLKHRAHSEEMEVPTSLKRELRRLGRTAWKKAVSGDLGPF